MMPIKDNGAAGGGDQLLLSVAMSELESDAVLKKPVFAKSEQTLKFKSEVSQQKKLR